VSFNVYGGSQFPQSTPTTRPPVAPGTGTAPLPPASTPTAPGSTLNVYTGSSFPQTGTNTTPPPGPAPTPTTPYGMSTTNANLNLRSTASMTGSILTVMPNGSNVTITGPAVNGWFPVSYNGRTGFASAQYINGFTPSTPSTGTTPAPTGTTPAPTGPTPPPTGPQAPATTPGSPFYNPASTYGSNQNWYDTPIVKQSQDFDSEWEKSITEQGYGGFGAKANVARNLVDRAKSGFSAATMNNPNLDPRTYINQSLGPNFLRNAMASMTPGQRGEMPGILQPRARWNDR
jgi:uncharacterized protein YraI